MSAENSELHTPHIVEKLSGAYEHLCHADGSLESVPYFGDVLKRDGGICWAASMSMAVASLTGKKSLDILSSMGEASFSYFPSHLSDIQDGLRERYGASGAIPFLENALSEMVDQRSGSLTRFFRRNYPVQTAHFFEYMMSNSMGIEGVKLEIVSGLAGYGTRHLENLGLGCSANSVAVLALHVDIMDKHGRRDSAGHMVFISGAELTNQHTTGLRMSDPNRRGPHWIKGDELTRLFSTGFSYRSGESTITATIEEDSPLIWFRGNFLTI